MTTRTYVTKSGDTYEWEETPEVVKALQEYWNIVNERSNQSN